MGTTRVIFTARQAAAALWTCGEDALAAIPYFEGSFRALKQERRRPRSRMPERVGP